MTLADFAQVVHAGQCGCRTGPGKGHTKAAAAVLRAVAARCEERSKEDVPEAASWAFHSMALELRRIAAEGTQASEGGDGGSITR